MSHTDISLQTSDLLSIIGFKCQMAKQAMKIQFTFFRINKQQNVQTAGQSK